MFDIGFFELLVIGVVALLVIGPEQLPETLRSLGLWWGRLKRGLQTTRTELEQHLGADDIRRQLHNEDIMRQLKATRQDIESVLDPKSAADAKSTPDSNSVHDGKTAADNESSSHSNVQPDTDAAKPDHKG